MRRSFSRCSLRSLSAIWKGLSDSSASSPGLAWATHLDSVPASTPSSRATSAYVTGLLLSYSWTALCLNSGVYLFAWLLDM